MRIEKDSLGAMEVPDGVYYGAHTARSLKNFNVAGAAVPPAIIQGLVRLKWACAQANRSLGLLPTDKADAIAAA